jgi:hypothetical protein
VPVPPLRFVLVPAAVVLVAAVSTGLFQGEPPSAPDRSPAQAGAFADLPLSFIKNRGQADPRVAYYLQGADASAYFTSRGLKLRLPGEGNMPGWILRQRFVGATQVLPEGGTPTDGVVSYFKGSPEQWQTALPTYSRVLYRDLWPGIDLVYRGDASRLKYSFVVHPGGNPADIRLAWDGATGLSATEAGRLRVSTPTGALVDEAPTSYQAGGAGRAIVPTSYAVAGHAYGFEVGPYDPRRTLVIDPAILLYAGFIGGSANDRAWEVAVDAAGAAYVTGTTASTEATFPEKVGPDLSFNGAARMSTPTWPR